jgi:archaellum component FlaF (FlaF/FlaG flagellin family)
MARTPRPLRILAAPALPIVLLMLFGLIAPISLVRAAADDMPKLAIIPADGDRLYVDLTLKPGKHQTLAVNLVNGGTVAVRARTYTADVYTMVNGGFAARLDGEQITGPTTWVDFSREDVDLVPGQTVQRDVTITVPKDAAPGEYVAALVIQTADPIKAGGGDLAVNQVLRAAIAVAITVPGPRKPELTIGAATYKHTPVVSSVLVGVTNAGNVRLKPKGEVVVTDGAGKEVLRASVAMDAFFAGDTTEIEVPLPQPLSPGAYSVGLQLTDEQAGAQAQHDSIPLPVPD